MTDVKLLWLDKQIWQPVKMQLSIYCQNGHNGKNKLDLNVVIVVDSL